MGNGQKWKNPDFFLLAPPRATGNGQGQLARAFRGICDLPEGPRIGSGNWQRATGRTRNEGILGIRILGVARKASLTTGNGQLPKREMEELLVLALRLDSNDRDGGGELIESSKIFED